MAKKQKTCLILYVNDPIGAAGKSADEEYADFKETLDIYLENEGVPKKSRKRLKFMNENAVNPAKSFDIMVLDYGGMSMCGSDMLVEYQITGFVNMIKDYPSRDFILVGWGLKGALTNEVQNTLGVDPEDLPNLHISHMSTYETVVTVIMDWLKYN